MAFVVPQYSREKVNLAGKILTEPDKYSIEERRLANVILGNWRASHAYPMNTYQATLRAKVGKVDADGLVAQRLKRTPSIINKLDRFGEMRLSRMQDIGGLRAVLETIPKIRKLERAYHESRWQHEMKPSKDYIDNPKEDGYRGIHLVFKYKNNRAPQYDGLLLELQLRTRLQHAWATAVETMGTFLGQALKSGQGDDEWKLFFSAAGAAFSHVEDAAPVPGYEGYSRIESYQFMAELEEQLNVLDKLRSFSVAADKISTTGKPGSYHLIVLDSLNKTVQITPYSKQELEKASECYSVVEQRIEGGEKLEAVLVSAGPVDALRRAYPNYFLDTHSFIIRIRNLINEAKKNASRTITGDVRKNLYKIYPEMLHFFPTPMIRKKDIPQADRLRSIREVVELIDSGADSVEKIHEITGINKRHINYRIASGVILSAICRDKGIRLTTLGQAWIRTRVGSNDESVLMRDMIEGSDFYSIICPNLLDMSHPERDQLVNRLVLYSGMSRSTAARRVGTIMSWYNQIKQLNLSL